MKIYKEMNLADFEFWSGAKDTVKYLSDYDFECIEAELECLDSEYSETEINDLFWFDDDWIAQILGYDDFDALIYDRTHDENKEPMEVEE